MRRTGAPGRLARGISLNSRFAILVWWVPDLILLYNDPYRQIIAGKHPAARGHPGRECCHEIWHIVGPMLQNVLETGRPPRRTPCGGGRASWPLAREAGGAALRVRDTGVGIAPDLLPHVFDLFFVPADRTLDRAHGGPGLGLTMVRRLAGPA